MTDVDNEIGLDLSWTSDLKMAWAERGDEYASPISDDPSSMEPSGETVGGTTDDDYGSETTSLLPRGVDASELTDKQYSILETAIMKPIASNVEVAAAVGASPQYVAEVCGRWLSNHPAASSPDAPDDDGQTTLDEWGGQA